MIEQIKFIDKSFNLQHINDYHLSLQVYLKGFSFCLLDRGRNKFIALGNYYFDKISSYNILLNEISEIFNTEEVLKPNYQHVKLLFATPKYSFIPSPFFDKNEVESIYSFNHSLKQNDKLHTNYIYGNSSYVTFAMHDYVENFFNDKYQNIKFYHHSCPLIEEVLLKDKLSSQKNKAFLNIMPDMFDIIIIEDGKLKLFNTFTYSTKTDFQYFVLNVFNQLNLSPIDIPVTIMGVIKRDDIIIENLKKYIKHINYFNKPAHFEYAYGFHNLADHYFTNLINLYQCG